MRRCPLLLAPWLLTVAVARGDGPLILAIGWPGAGAAALADDVAKPIEDALAGIDGVLRIRSWTRAGECLVRLDPAPSATLDNLQLAVLARLQPVTARLPAACGVPTLGILPDSDQAMIIASLVEERPGLALAAALELRRSLLLRPGVAAVEMFGAVTQATRVRVDPARLTAVGATLTDVWESLRTGRDGSSPEELGAMVFAHHDGARLTIADVARVEFAAVPHESAGTAVLADVAGDAIGRRGVLLFVSAPGSSTAAVDAELSKARHDLPVDVRLEAHRCGPGDLLIAVRFPAGAALESMDAACQALASFAVRAADADRVLWMTSTDDDVALLPVIAPRAAVADLRAALRPSAAELGGAICVDPCRWPLGSWPGEGRPVIAKVFGADRTVVRETAGALAASLTGIAGAVDVDVDLAARVQLAVDIDREACAAAGVPPAAVHATYLAACELLERGGNGLPPIELDELLVRAANGELKPWRGLATLHQTLAPAAILREGGRECVVVSANVAGRNAAAVKQELRATIADLTPAQLEVVVE